MSIPAKMDDRRKVIEYFQKQQVFIQSEAVDYLMQQGDCMSNARRVLDCVDGKPLNIVLDDVKHVFQAGRHEQEERAASTDTSPISPREEPGQLEVLKDVTGNSCCEGTLTDFTKLFRDRYAQLHRLLRKRQEMKHVIPVKKARERDGAISVIGIVDSVTRSSKGHVLMDIEDESGGATVYIPEEDAGMADTLVEDEVIGVIGICGRDGLLIAQQLLRPDVPVHQTRHRSNGNGYAAFASDIHIGSKTFLEKEWKKFMRWMNGEVGTSRQQEVARHIQYLIIPGDVVEGVGIYPNQEQDLYIEDIYEQYRALAEELSAVPREVTIVLQPGNHDAVRQALPQPAFEDDVQRIFSGLNVVFVGNPASVRLDGLEVLLYHGQSLFDFSTRIGVNQNQPTEIMKHMLMRRHMAPIYGEITPLAPEQQDYMVIDRIPDVFVTGHVHTTAIDSYRGVQLINASTWQSQTDYQRMMNFMPDPAKVPIVSLGSGRASLMDFST